MASEGGPSSRDPAAGCVWVWGNTEAATPGVQIFFLSLFETGFLFYSFFFSFCVRVLCDSGWVLTHYVAQDDFELLLLLPPWDDRRGTQGLVDAKHALDPILSPEFRCAAQAVLELSAVLLPQFPKCWNDRCELPDKCRGF